MGTNLFGIDIAGIVHEATKGQLVALTLHKSTPTARNPVDLGGGQNPTIVNHPCEGFIEDQNVQAAGTGYQGSNDTIVKRTRVVTIIGNSLPAGVAPMGRPDGTNNDRITVAGELYTITNVKSDPAQAVYTCRVVR